MASTLSSDWHKHICYECGFIWDHSLTECKDHEPSHTCLRCGAVQWWIYAGQRQPEALINTSGIQVYHTHPGGLTPHRHDL
jgi:hypothetical protein